MPDSDDDDTEDGGMMTDDDDDNISEKIEGREPSKRTPTSLCKYSQPGHHLFLPAEQ